MPSHTIVRFRNLASLAAIAIAVAAQPAFADEAAGDAIIVTAQKKNEDILTVPVPVTAISASELLAHNSTRILDYFAAVPGLNVNQGASNQMNISIRGITTGPTMNPAVGVVVDEVPYGSTSILTFGSRMFPDIDPADLSQIEVLRGPQGTLYGASSIGGLIKFGTQAPSTKAFSARVQATASTVSKGEEGVGTRASVNIPLSSTLAVRASGFFRRDPGYVDNVQTGQDDVNRSETYGGHIALLWQPVDALTVQLGALFQNLDARGTSEVDTDYQLKPRFGELTQSRLAGTGPYHGSARLFSARVTYDAGPIEVASITGYGINKYRNYQDLSYTYGGYSETYFGYNATAYTQDLETRKFSQELRISNKNPGFLDWTLGGFYTHETSPTKELLYAVDPDTGEQKGLLAKFDYPSTFSEYAAFANATAHLTEALSLQFGGRYSANHQTYHETDTGALVVGGIDAKYKGHAFTFQVSPQYTISPNLMVYGRIASGYRIAGPNAGATLGYPASYKPDRTVNYEIGTKGKLLGNLLTFDASIYYIDWKNIQLRLADPDTGFSYYTNGPRAKSEGAELALSLNPGKGLKVTATGSYNVAQLERDIPTGGLYGLNGDRLPYSARFQGGVSLDQTFAVTDSWNGNVGATVTYLGARRGQFQPTAADIRLRLPAYATVDLRATLSNDDWEFGLFVQNVGDRRGITGADVLALSGTSTTATPFYANYIRPRTIGLSVARNFR